MYIPGALNADTDASTITQRTTMEDNMIGCAVNYIMTLVVGKRYYCIGSNCRQRWIGFRISFEYFLLRGPH